MNEQELTIFAKLPTDTINIILEFYGRIKYKRGKYTNIIAKNDQRYDMLSQIQYPIYVKYTMDYEVSLPEHFETCIYFNEKYNLRAFNLSVPPNQISYFFHRSVWFAVEPFEDTIGRYWFRD